MARKWKSLRLRNVWWLCKSMNALSHNNETRVDAHIPAGAEPAPLVSFLPP